MGRRRSRSLGDHFGFLHLETFGIPYLITIDSSQLGNALKLRSRLLRRATGPRLTLSFAGKNPEHTVLFITFVDPESSDSAWPFHENESASVECTQ
jgi:hypothetical protein